MLALRSCLLVAAAIAALGCSKQSEEPHGQPVLLQVLWEIGGPPQLVWSRDADAAVVALAPATVTKIDFVFDRRLDGARIEDTVDGGPAPKANPPITIHWPDMTATMSDPPFVADVFYNSLPAWGIGTTHAFVRPRIVGLPSATPVTFSLDPNGLTSVYGEPMDGPPEITVTTEPLTATLPNSTATVPTSYLAPIAFSTRAAALPALAAFVHVASGGATLPFVLAGDKDDRRRVYVKPADCLGGWPPGARVDIDLDPGLPDGFGRPLAAALKGSFMTAAIAGPPVDGGCAPTDGGTPDGGATDGEANDTRTGDADISDAGISDAEPDAAQAN
jgi:hypothetical protein